MVKIRVPKVESPDEWVEVLHEDLGNVVPDRAGGDAPCWTETFAFDGKTHVHQCPVIEGEGPHMTSMRRETEALCTLDSLLSPLGYDVSLMNIGE